MPTDMTTDVELPADVVATHGPFCLTQTGAVMTGDPTFEQWMAAVEWAQKVEKASLFWLGDLQLYGERFGEEASQVLDAMGFAAKTLANTKSVAKEIPPSRRRESLSFSHHDAVAGLPTAEQDEWLDEAEALDLSVHELRHRIRGKKAISEGRPREFWLEVRCNDVNERDQLVERLRSEGLEVKLMTK